MAKRKGEEDLRIPDADPESVAKSLFGGEDNYDTRGFRLTTAIAVTSKRPIHSQYLAIG